MTMSKLQLGRKVDLPESPDKAVLDCVDNPAGSYVLRFTVPEFSSLCPITGQPDFAHIVIDYVPNKWLLESKSLKLFMGSFRNHGAFHEACTAMIGDRIFDKIEPHWLRVGGYWFSRGGISIDVFWQKGNLPDALWVPDQNVPGFRGRG